MVFIYLLSLVPYKMLRFKLRKKIPFSSGVTWLRAECSLTTKQTFGNGSCQFIRLVDFCLHFSNDNRNGIGRICSVYVMDTDVTYKPLSGMRSFFTFKKSPRKSRCPSKVIQIRILVYAEGKKSGVNNNGSRRE